MSRLWKALSVSLLWRVGSSRIVMGPSCLPFVWPLFGSVGVLMLASQMKEVSALGSGAGKKRRESMFIAWSYEDGQQGLESE